MAEEMCIAGKEKVCQNFLIITDMLSYLKLFDELSFSVVIAGV